MGLTLPLPKVRVCRDFSNPPSLPRDPYVINEWPQIHLDDSLLECVVQYIGKPWDITFNDVKLHLLSILRLDASWDKRNLEISYHFMNA